MKKKFLLVLLASTMLFSSCVFTHDKPSSGISYEDEREIIEDGLEDVPIEVEDYHGDLTPLPIKEDVECEATKSLYEFKKGDPNQYINVISLDEGYNPALKDLRLRNEFDEDVSIQLVSSSNGVGRYLIPVSSFDVDHQYILKLLNSRLYFETKDPSIRELRYYELEVNDSNRVHTVQKSDINFKNHSIDNVQYFDVDALGTYFIYDGKFNCKVGEYFRISDLTEEKDNKETVYGKVSSISENPNGAGKIIRYEPADGEQIYKNLAIKDEISINDDTAENLEMYGDKEDTALELGRSFLAHEDVITAMSGLYRHFKVKPEKYRSSPIDWASHLKVSFSTKFEDAKFTWGCSITLTLNPEDNFSVKLALSYKQTTQYKISADVSIKWKWKVIPTGVKYELRVEEDDTKEVSFKIAISTNLAPADTEKVQESIANDLAEAFAKNSDVKSKFAGDGPTSTADGRSYPLIRFDLYYFFPIDIRIEIDFYWKLQITVECDVTYTSHTKKVDVDITNNKGDDPHSETQTMNDKNLTFAFMGTFHAEVGVRASFGVGISGLYRFFHAEVYVTAYGAVDAQGYLLADLHWDSEGAFTITEHCGGKFEVSAGVKWGVDVVLLFGGYSAEWPIVSVILAGFSNGNCIDSFVQEEDQIDLTNFDYSEEEPIYISLDDYHLLGVNVFDSKNMTSTFMDLKHDDTTKLRYGKWIDDYSKEYFRFELEHPDNEYLELTSDFKVRIKKINAVETFDENVFVYVNDETKSGSQVVKKTIKIHFENNNKQKIYIQEPGEDRQFIGSYLMDTDVLLPVGVAPRYKKFVGWREVTSEHEPLYIPYDENNPQAYHVPNDEHIYFYDITFEYVYEDYYYWNVVWVDGLGHIIKIEDVINETSATPPEPSIRDRYMVSENEEYEYVFIGWDIEDYSSITQNTVIRGIYEYRKKVGA